VNARGLAARAVLRFATGAVVVVGVLLGCAGTVAYWQAWAYCAVVFVPMASFVVWLLRHDPVLLERRLAVRERDPRQRRIVALGALCFTAVFVVPGLDRRFSWAQVPVAASLAADVAMLLGYALFVRVLLENRYASRVVDVEAGQPVVTTGPYAFVRHPMYVAAIAMMIATPIALGSWWGLVPAAPLVAVFVARIGNEEALLRDELPGYSAYAQRTKYRLLPGLW